LLNDDALGERFHWKYCRTGGAGSGRKQISGISNQRGSKRVSVLALVGRQTGVGVRVIRAEKRRLAAALQVPS
jgi:hypothetical protein